MKPFLHLTICLLGLLLTCNGSGYLELRFDSMKIGSKSEKIDISLDNMLNEVNVEVKVEGEVISIDPKFLWGAKNIKRSSVRVEVGPLDPNSPKEIDANKVGFTLSFEFGGTYDHGSVDNEVIVYQFVRLHFKDGKFRFSELYQPLGEYKNKWKLSDRWPESQNDAESFFEGISKYE
jgi:hypothetical protein